MRIGVTSGFAMTCRDSWIEAGAVVRPHGIKGEVVVDLKSDLVDLVVCGSKVRLAAPEGEEGLFEVERARDHNGRLVVKLRGIDTRDGAEALRTWVLWMTREQVGELPEGRYFVDDILGLSVYCDTGECLGRVEEVLTMPASDVYVVRSDSEEILLPVIDEVVKEVDVEGGRMVVRLMEGMRQGGK
ncbi:MAG: ribosome maturation factor RimM [Candidatus Eisenbacteria bacterium]